MPTVTIDCRFAAGATGLGRYTRSLVQALLERNDPWSTTLFVAPGSDEWLSSLPKNVRTITLSQRHYTFAEHRALRGAIADANADLHFAPHFLLPLRCPVPSVATIHDLILHRYPNGKSLFAQLAYRFVFNSTLRRASEIIAVSSFVADELLQRFGASIASKVTVIGEGVDACFAPVSDDRMRQVRNAYGLPEHFFLYVGNAKQHKNVPVLLAAYERLPQPRPALVLVSGGDEALQLALPEGCVLLRHVEDADLPALYSSALCLALPSLYEGFGLPVVEAIACGCPVIAAKTSAIPETAKGKATLVEPTVDAFTSTLLHPPKRPAPVALWSWEEAAAKTAALLRRNLDRVY